MVAVVGEAEVRTSVTRDLLSVQKRPMSLVRLRSAQVLQETYYQCKRDLCRW
jgi:hypothetical protein